MKRLLALVFSFATLTWVPVLGQSSTSPSSLPQITLPTDANTTSAPATPAISLPATAAAPAPAPAASTVTVPADPAAAFSAGVAAYDKGDFATAREYFSGAEKKSVSSSLEYNLGNACYQTGDYGAAILHYLRSLALNPRDPDARQNLALARKGANIPVPDLSRLDRYAQYFNKNTWSWITTIAGWAALYLAFLPRLYRWRGITPWLLCLVAFTLAVAGGVGVWGAQKHAHDGVVLHAETTVRLSPTANSSTIAMLQPGEVAQTLEQHGDYFKILAASGQIGWVDAANYSPVEN